MNIELPRSATAFDVPTKQLNRRQLVKAGAWAAPAVILAVATPPASASTPAPAPTPGIPDLVFTNLSAGAQTRYVPGHSLASPPWWVAGYAVLNRIDGNTSVGLSYFATDPTAAVTSITLTLTVSDATGLLGTKPTVTSGSGWVASSGALSGATATYVFSWAGSISAGQAGQPGYTSQLTFSLPSDDLSKPSALPWPKTIAAMAIATNAHAATTSASAGQP
ncbi:hypothetical protein [Microbacterium sp.]|uniref:hypothetical protein n=1 Tax=Microbacterium sp. TaxID=51671 RepID=UPI0025E1B171|nr:hypothetical protein [Microbacterium sp.]